MFDSKYTWVEINEKIRVISKSRWRRRLFGILLDLHIALRPLITDEALSAWADAREQSRLARERVTELVRVLWGEPAMMLRVTLRTYRKSFRLYAVAVRRTLGGIVQLVIR